MRRACVSALGQIANTDPRLLLLTADLGFMVLEEFSAAHPSRFFNVGVAEANMIGLATGLASCGYVPFVYSIATFASMRAYEQIRNGPVQHNLPVRIIGVGGGFEYGFGGFSHHAFEDLGIARLQPNLTVIAPADSAQTVSAIHATYDLPGPVYYRIGKRDDRPLPALGGRFRLGRIETLLEGPDIAILAMGSLVSEAWAAAESIFRKGVRATLSVVSSLRPAPVKDIREALERFPVAITVEEHYVDGGLGSLVSEIVAEAGIGCRIVRCGVRGITSGCGDETYLRRLAGLSSDGIAKTALMALGVGDRR